MNHQLDWVVKWECGRGKQKREQNIENRKGVGFQNGKWKREKGKGKCELEMEHKMEQRVI